MNTIETAKKLLSILNDNGYEAYIVGGYVRDRLAKLEESYDIDITTSARVLDLKRLFCVKETGTLYESVVIVFEDEEFEITTFRADVSYDDHRHPVIKYVDNYKEDLKRRDYTINALLMDKNEKIIDEYGAKEDIIKRQIKMIGDPYIRFDEDALRILRGIYLVAKLGYSLSADVYAAMKAKAPLLAYVSSYRKRIELEKILKVNKNNKVFSLMAELGISEYFPSLLKGIEFAKRSSMPINSKDIFYSVAFILNNGVDKTYEFDKAYSKKLENIVKLASDEITPLRMMGEDREIASTAQLARAILKLDDKDVLKLYDNMPIHSIKDIDIERSYLIERYSAKNVAKILDEVAKEILAGKIKNNSFEIKSYLEKRK